MEVRGSTPLGVLRAEDLATLALQAGPVLSLYLGTEGSRESAAARSALRWKTLRRELADMGAPAGVLSSVDPLVPDAHLAGNCLAVIAGSEGIRHVEHGPYALDRDRCSWGPLPHLVPIMAWRQAAVPYMQVLADRTGADLFAVSPGETTVHEEAGGADDPIRKVAPGGWSQRRYQQRAENTWEHNANDVARELVALAARTDPRVVLVGGDVRALQLLRETLPGDILAKTVEISMTRATDGSDQHAEAAMQRELTKVVEADEAALLRKYAEELGQRDRAVDGVDETIGALQRAQVDVLLLADGAVPGRSAWFGPEPMQIATKPNALETFGIDRATEAPLADALVRAAWGTDASIRVLPGSAPLGEGVGALLRWR